VPGAPATAHSAYQVATSYPLETRFGGGGNVRQSRRAGFCSDGERPDETALDVLCRRPETVEHDVDLAADQVLQRRAGAFVWNMREIDASLRF
jgi:hypothetical protein